MTNKWLLYHSRIICIILIPFFKQTFTWILWHDSWKVTSVTLIKANCKFWIAPCISVVLRRKRNLLKKLKKNHRFWFAECSRFYTFVDYYVSSVPFVLKNSKDTSWYKRPNPSQQAIKKSNLCSGSCRGQFLPHRQWKKNSKMKAVDKIFKEKVITLYWNQRCNHHFYFKTKKGKRSGWFIAFNLLEPFIDEPVKCLSSL